jgi:hypothetical protein
LIIFAGDFNCNGQKENKKAKVYREQLMHRPDFDKYLDELENEYKSMIDVLSNKEEDLIIDCAKIANKGECPITYADVTTDLAGNVVPKEVVLTDKEDYLTCQSLDYIF